MAKLYDQYNRIGMPFYLMAQIFIFERALERGR
jgi:hypothetical protein